MQDVLLVIAAGGTLFNSWQIARLSGRVDGLESTMQTVLTTIEIPERLLRHAKAHAALRGLRLKDVVCEALQRHLAESGSRSAHAGASGPDSQQLGSGRVFPLVSGATGAEMPGLRGAAAQRLLDEEDVDREVHPG